MDKPTHYVAPPISDKKRYIAQCFEIDQKSVADIAKDLNIQETSVIKNLLDSYQNDIDVDFTQLYNQYSYLSHECIDQAKEIITKLELEKQLYTHQEGFLLRDIKQKLEADTSGIFNDIESNHIYNIIHIAKAQLYYDRWHRLPRKSRKTLIKKNGSYVTGGAEKESRAEDSEMIHDDITNDIDLHLDEMTDFEKKTISRTTTIR